MKYLGTVSIAFILIVTLFAVSLSFFSGTRSVDAQISGGDSLDTSFLTDSVYKSLKEYSSIPIEIQSIQLGRLNPFLPFSSQNSSVSDESEGEQN